MSWAAFHEGPSDGFYLEVLLPRVLEDILARDGTHNSDVPLVPAIRLGLNGREIEEVAAEICGAQEAISIVFIHADTGGRALEAGIASRSKAFCDRCGEICEWPPERCVTITPRHETEAWILADPHAVTGALGYNGDFRRVGLPEGATQAERLVDPKATLSDALASMTGRRRKARAVDQVFAAIAQRQSLEALRRSRSFQTFETRLRTALANLGCIPTAAV